MQGAAAAAALESIPKEEIVINRFWVTLHRLMPESVCYFLYCVALKISPRLIPESLRPGPIVPLTPRNFLAGILAACRENADSKVFFTLDDIRVGEKAILYELTDDEIERIVVHGL
jgi:hypothetical protein